MPSGFCVSLRVLVMPLLAVVEYVVFAGIESVSYVSVNSVSVLLAVPSGLVVVTVIVLSLLGLPVSPVFSALGSAEPVA